MRVAVTGATGFIGRHVLATLRRHDVDVVLVSRRPVPAPPSGSRACCVQLDLASPPDDVFDRLGRPDTLIHLAWDGLPNYHSLHHIETELPAQYRFLACMVHSGLRSMVISGTCFEYGMQSGPLSECTLLRPNNPYGFAKNALRCQLEFLRQRAPFALSWARLFYLHGAGQAANSLLPQLQRAVEAGDPVFNMSGGEQLRDYLPVEDVARHLVMMALHELDAGAVNICSGQPVSVRHFVEKLIAAQHWNIDLNLGHYPYPDYEPLAFWGRRDRLDALIAHVSDPTHHAPQRVA